MCGVTALLLRSADSSIANQLEKALRAIQHRGYDGAGIALSGPKEIILAKGYGLIQEVLWPEVLEQISAVGVSRMGLAHTRYKTVGEVSSGASQPILSSDRKLCLVHNGQIEAKNYIPVLLRYWIFFRKHSTKPKEEISNKQ